MSYKLSGQLIALCASLATALVGGLYYDLAIAILSPLGLRMLAISTWLLLLLSVILLTLFLTSYFKKNALKKQLDEALSYIDENRPANSRTYHEQIEFNKHFDELSSKDDL